MKTCVICGHENIGRHANAKTCSVECSQTLKRRTAKPYQQAYYDKNKATVLAKSRQRSIDFPEQVRLVKAAYRQRHADRLRNESRERAVKNRVFGKAAIEILKNQGIKLGDYNA